MEPSITMNADGIRDEKVKVFCSIENLPVDEVQSLVVAAQYAEGWATGHRVISTNRRLSAQHHRDLRCAKPACRQLALGRYAVVHPHRETHAEADE